MAAPARHDQVERAASSPPPRQLDGLSLGGLARGHWPRLLGGAGALGIVAVAGALYAYLTGPLLALLLSGGERGGAAFGGLLARLPWATSGPPATLAGEALLVRVAALLLAIALVKGLAQLAQAMLLDATAERIGHELRVRVYGHLLRRPLVSQRPRAVGELIARLLDDVRRVQQATVGAAIGLLRDGLAALALLGVALWLSPRLTLLALVALPLVVLAIGLIGRRVRGAAAAGQREVGDLAARAGAGLAALREVKSCGAEGRELAQVERRSRAALGWVSRRIRARASGPLVNEVLAAVGLGVTLVIAGRQIAAGQIDPERVVSFFTAILLLYRPIKGISVTVQAVAAGRPSVERVAELLAEPVERPPDRRLPDLARSLSLREVGFSYPSDDSWRLGPVDLELTIGRVVVVAGPSGAGKSTLANLVCGLARPGSGSLRWDGEDLGAWPLASLRAAVALVPQQPLIFDGSLADNLRYGAPDASEAALWEALDAAALSDWARSLPDGLQTLLGPVAGRAPSVGQLQRLSVARALLRGTRVVVLDEPTSALDAEAAARLGQTIRAVARGAAVMIIAHGPRLLALADEVLRLGDGGAVGSASPPPQAEPEEQRQQHR